MQLLLAGRNLTMRVDGGVSRCVIFSSRCKYKHIHHNTRSVLNDGPRDRLRVSRPLYLGGLPGHVGEAALGLWHLRNTTSLRGCVLGLSINNKQLDFLQAAARVGGVAQQAL